METTLSSKGQIVIPQRIRQNHGWSPGLSFTIIEKDNSLILQPISAKMTTKLEDVIGCAGYHGKKKSLTQMEAGILEEAKRQAKSW
ncbi:MAG: AbrB/MazE/SpoVT family DNA-binding domain-containing protein [Deltaproteobacteria bacterium]|nr:AbrB/MazE/SpoVT family DNA-binding domain-containing protein [Deltaproteobacteria bacterium]